MNPSAGELWAFLPVGYLLTIAIEAPILLLALSRAHPLRRRAAAGVWLTACTYPIVVLVLPLAMSSAERWQYLVVAETFAPLAECTLFALAFHSSATTGRNRLQDFCAIVVANLASFVVGGWLVSMWW